MKSKGFLRLLLLLVVLMQVFAIPAYALPSEDLALMSVRIDTNIYTMSEEGYVAVNTPLDPGELGVKPRIVLVFNHSVQSETAEVGKDTTMLERNLSRIHIEEIGENGEFLRYVESTEGAYYQEMYGDSKTALFIRPEISLLDGYYKVVVEKGIESRNHNTAEAYAVYFSVGEASEVFELPDDAKFIDFKVRGISNGASPIITVKDAQELIIYPYRGTAFALSPGEYSYAVSAAGHITANGSFSVTENAEQSVTLRDHVYLTVKVSPADAEISVKADQTNYIAAESPGKFKLTPGINYTYICQREGYLVESGRVTPHEDTEISVTMQEDKSASAYKAQGNGGNTVTMLSPSGEQIEVVEETEAYYYNRITAPLSNTAALEFVFTMASGMNNFNADNFSQNTLANISIYKYAAQGVIGEEAAGLAQGTLVYIDFDRSIKGIKIAVPAARLTDGKYILRFGDKVSGNNTGKTLGKPVMFEFVIGAVQPSAAGIAGYTDVAGQDWFAPAVSFVSSQKLFFGTADKVFSPDIDMNRGMLVTVLQRLAKAEYSGAEQGIFPDVDNNMYYAVPVKWAVEMKLTSGYADGCFYPEKAVTRQEAASFLYRFYCNVTGGEQSLDAKLLQGFADSSDIAAWSEEALCWAVQNGIMQGYPDNTLKPMDTATRAQIAQLIMNFVERFLVK